MKPRRLETEIVISAPISSVWSVLIDFEKYKDWNSSLQVINFSHPQKTNSSLLQNEFLPDHLDLSIHPQKAKATQAKVRMLERKKPFMLSWEGKLFGVPGLLIGRHHFELISIEETKTQVLHYEDFRGLLVQFVWKSYLTTVLKEVFESFNTSLKKKCETQ